MSRKQQAKLNKLYRKLKKRYKNDYEGFLRDLVCCVVDENTPSDVLYNMFYGDILNKVIENGEKIQEEFINNELCLIEIK